MSALTDLLFVIDHSAPQSVTHGIVYHISRILIFLSIFDLQFCPRERCRRSPWQFRHAKSERNPPGIVQTVSFWYQTVACIHVAARTLDAEGSQDIISVGLLARNEITRTSERAYNAVGLLRAEDDRRRQYRYSGAPILYLPSSRTGISAE